MKTCTICKKEKPLDEFNKKKTSRDGLQSICRDCNKKASREYYSRNKEHHQQVVYKAKAKYRKEREDRFWELLEGESCKDCGEEDSRVLEFDHLENKKANIATMLANGCAWDTIKKEIDKCDVVCANCHRIRTYERDNSWRHKRFLGV